MAGRRHPLKQIIPVWSGVKDIYGLRALGAAPQLEALSLVCSDDGRWEGGRGTRAPRRPSRGQAPALPTLTQPAWPEKPLPPCALHRAVPEAAGFPHCPACLSCLPSQGTASPWASASPYRRFHQGSTNPAPDGLASLGSSSSIPVASVRILVRPEHSTLSTKVK